MDLLELGHDIPKKAKNKFKLKKLIYPFTQLGVFLLSFLANALPLIMNNDWIPTYPFSNAYFPFFNPYNYLVHVGNLGGSMIFQKKIKVKWYFIILFILINFLLSAFSFILINELTTVCVSESLAGTGIGVAYGVHHKK
ncbi:MAG: hypothetical protein ACXABK_03980 [Candidatus Heimdallarchaeaceae archaeon]